VIHRVDVIFSPARTDGNFYYQSAALDLDSIYNHQTVVTNTGQGRPCPVPPEQLPDLGRSLTGWQFGQEAPQVRNYH